MELSGRSVLIATLDPLAAALSLIELDGIARRLVICTPDVAVDHFSSLVFKAGIDAIVSDHDLRAQAGLGVALQISCSPTIIPLDNIEEGLYPTEWVLLTSGTTGEPKMVVHTIASLTAPFSDVKREGTNRANGTNLAWGTFYDIRRYGGLQIFLRFVLGNGSFVLSSPAESPDEYLSRLAEHMVTHVSGTPSHWRRTLMSPLARTIDPCCVRLSGEIADQGILNTLHSFYPHAGVSHAFASTEAGLAFEVDDGLEGFPATMVGVRGDVELKIQDGSLRIRSHRIASRYLGDEGARLSDDEGFVDTGDLVELRADRYYFLGRRSGVVNVGGLKVHPEEVEAVINRHPSVLMSIVRSRKNPIVGALVVADVVLTGEAQDRTRRQAAELTREILETCRDSLAAHKVPATIRFVPALEVAASGKMARHDA
jgi:acyl-CoA synthetase (AMP-forming)/AMP-acid ligase II